MWVIMVIVVQFSPALFLCHPSRMASIHLKGNLQTSLSDSSKYTSSNILPLVLHSWVYVIFTLLALCIFSSHLPKVIWEQSQFLFIFPFQCLPQYLEYGRSSRDGLKEMDEQINGNKEEWEGGSRDKLKMTRYLCFSASFHLTSHTHVQYYSILKIKDYVTEIYIYFLYCFNWFKFTPSELKYLWEHSLKSKLNKKF